MKKNFLVLFMALGLAAGVNAQEQQKFLYNGHVYITRGGKVYDMLGQVVEL